MKTGVFSWKCVIACVLHWIYSFVLYCCSYWAYSGNCIPTYKWNLWFIIKVILVMTYCSSLISWPACLYLYLHHLNFSVCSEERGKKSLKKLHPLYTVNRYITESSLLSLVVIKKSQDSSFFHRVKIQIWNNFTYKKGRVLRIQSFWGVSHILHSAVMIWTNLACLQRKRMCAEVLDLWLKNGLIGKEFSKAQMEGCSHFNWHTALLLKHCL